MIYPNSNFRKKGGRDKKESRISPAGMELFSFFMSLFWAGTATSKAADEEAVFISFSQVEIFSFPPHQSRLCLDCKCRIEALPRMPLSEPVRRAVGFGANAHFPFPLSNGRFGPRENPPK